MRRLWIIPIAVLLLGATFATTYRGTFNTTVFDTDAGGGANDGAGYFYNTTRWTNAEMTAALGSSTTHGKYLGFFPYKNYSVGSPIGTALGTVFNTLEATYPHPRVCVDHRPDLQVLYDDSITDTLLVGTTNQRYCAATTPNNCTTWEGYMTTCQGGSNAGTRCVVGDSTCAGGGTCGAADEVFNTDWIMRVPIAEHDALVTSRWGGVDPFDADSGSNYQWSTALDAATIRGLATASTVPAIYAEYNNSLYPNKSFIGSVVIDLRIAAARAWKIKQLIETLEDYGVTSATDDMCVFWSYKPGWYGYEPVAQSTANYQGCREDGDRAYAGHLWGATEPVECGDGSSSRPFHDTQYGPGEYEEAANAYYRELIAALDAAGLDGVKLMVQRAPAGYSTTIYDEIPSLVKSRRFLGEITVSTTDPVP